MYLFVHLEHVDQHGRGGEERGGGLVRVVRVGTRGRGKVRFGLE